MNNFQFHKAETEAIAVSKKENSNKTKFIAGGTNLLDLWKYNIENPTTLLDINGLIQCKEIRQLEDGSLRLGALTTNAETAYYPLIEKNYPLLSRAILAGASPQIRNMATNGGNLLQRTRCYYFYDTEVPCNKRVPGSGCPAITGINRMHAILGQSDACIAVFPSDMCVALSALNAVINILGRNGKRTIPFSEFHVLPGTTPEIENTLQQDELITSIDLPGQTFSANYSYLKIRDRHSYAFALVSVASAFHIEENIIHKARIALGGVAHKPWRIAEAEEFLVDKAPSAENFSKAADIIIQGAKGYTHNQFKIPLAKEAIIRNCTMALNPESQRPGAQPSL